jgi:hypothetical protein
MNCGQAHLSIPLVALRVLTIDEVPEEIGPAGVLAERENCLNFPFGFRQTFRTIKNTYCAVESVTILTEGLYPHPYGWPKSAAAVGQTGPPS